MSKKSKAAEPSTASSNSSSEDMEVEEDHLKYLHNPPSAYMLYQQAWRKQIAEENPDMTNGQIMAEVGARWKKEDQHTKLKFGQKAAKQSLEYEMERAKLKKTHPELFKTPAEEKAQRQAKKANKKVRPPSGYAKNSYNMFVKENPGPIGEIAAQWNELSASQKATYSAAGRQQFEEEHPDQAAEASEAAEAKNTKKRKASSDHDDAPAAKKAKKTEEKDEKIEEKKKKTEKKHHDKPKEESSPKKDQKGHNQTPSKPKAAAAAATPAKSTPSKGKPGMLHPSAKKPKASRDFTD